MKRGKKMLTLMIIGDDGETVEREVNPLWRDVETGEIYTPEMVDWNAMDMDRPSWVWGSF